MQRTRKQSNSSILTTETPVAEATHPPCSVQGLVFRAGAYNKAVLQVQSFMMFGRDRGCLGAAEKSYGSGLRIVWKRDPGVFWSDQSAIPGAPNPESQRVPGVRTRVIEEEALGFF